MDPQHRILLELAHEALENAGYDPDRYQGRIGVFTGSALNTYFMNAGLNGRLAEEYIPTLIGNDKDFLSTRISYKLNLKGPSITVQTACSTSMVAVHLARQSLLSRETDMASGRSHIGAGPSSCRLFLRRRRSASPRMGTCGRSMPKANGTVFGSGGGILVLKRLADAIADGDTIHAVIKGSAVNNDGSEKAGYTAPSVNSQADAVVEALANAGVEADSISYIEAHGSGTPVGDPIEIRALTKAFRTSTPAFRLLRHRFGKNQHRVISMPRRRVAGMIKTVLALKHRKLPPSLHFNEANPEIDFPATPFYVNTELREWTSDGPRRAGVMSTGMGGTNAHVVLEEAPEPAASTVSSPPHLLMLSAKTETALDQATHRLREFLINNEPVNMSDVAYTLQVGRKAFRTGDVWSVLDRRGRHSRPRSGRVEASTFRPERRIAAPGDPFVARCRRSLRGHGATISMRRGPSSSRKSIDAQQILEPHLGIDIRDIIYPESQSWKKGARAKEST